jgi:hypothetical protein
MPIINSQYLSNISTLRIYSHVSKKKDKIRMNDKTKIKHGIFNKQIKKKKPKYSSNAA